MERYLDVINDRDEVIGKETRSKIHREGLLHREIHVWFVTPQKEIIFQHRSPTKDTYPDLLDATVGGHVDLGMNYEDTAIKEIEEETGLRVSPHDLVLVRTRKDDTQDVLTNTTNRALQNVYAHIFKGKITDLAIEEGECQGFEAWSIEKLLNLNENDKKRFIPKRITSEFIDFYKELVALV